jgi:hypothetical protein
VAPPPGRIKLIDNRTRYMEVWQVRLRHLLASIKAIPGRYKMMPKKNLIPFLLPAVVIAFVASSLVVLFGYTPGTAAPFPYVPPPEGDTGYYIGTTTSIIANSFRSHYGTPFDEIGNIGRSFIFKDVLVTVKGLTTREVVAYSQSGEIEVIKTETYFSFGLILLFPKNLDKWQQLKAGDVVDIIGVYNGVSEEYQTVVVFRNCDFFPAGVVPLPLPGGAVITGGGY